MGKLWEVEQYYTICIFKRSLWPADELLGRQKWTQEVKSVECCSCPGWRRWWLETSAVVVERGGQTQRALGRLSWQELQGTRLSMEVKGKSTSSENTLPRPTVNLVGLGRALAARRSKTRPRIINWPRPWGQPMWSSGCLTLSSTDWENMPRGLWGYEMLIRITLQRCYLPSAPGRRDKESLITKQSRLKWVWSECVSRAWARAERGAFVLVSTSGKTFQERCCL